MSYSIDTLQVNTRVDRTLKREGDAALAAAGYTPSQAVRANWELAVKLRKNPEKLRALLSGQPSTPGVQAPGNSLSEEATPANDDGLRAHRERMATIQKRFDDLGITRPCHTPMTAVAESTRTRAHSRRHAHAPAGLCRLGALLPYATCNRMATRLRAGRRHMVPPAGSPEGVACRVSAGKAGC